MRYSAALFLGLCFNIQLSYADTLAIVTNSQNGIEGLTKSEVINIFLGRYRQYANGASAKPLDNLAYKDMFYQALVGKTPAEINAYWARLIFSGRTHPPEKAKDSEQVIAYLIKEPSGVSYINYSQLDKLSSQIKVLLVLESSK